jgi:hypothetical protein
MKIKRMVKRMSVVFTGALMLGATAMGALAADLNNYPDMFVDNGVFDGYFVVGENAASVDNLAMTDIAASMKYMAADGATSVNVEGDAWLVKSGSDELEFGETIGPTASGVVDFIDEDHLAALAPGTLTSSQGTFDYEQYIYFDNAAINVTYMEDDSDPDEITDLYVYIADNTMFARYELNFLEAAESDIDSSESYKLDDYEDKKIAFLGKEFDIVKAVTGGANNNKVTLTLMSGSASDTLLEGEKQTYMIGDTEYEVELSFTDSSNRAKFIVNGASTPLMDESDTETLADGTVLGLSQVLYQNYAGGIHSAEFFLGADKLVLEDDDILVGSSTDELKINDETIDGAAVIITGTILDNATSVTEDGELEIDTISVNMTSQDHYYVAAGESLLEQVELEEKDLVFSQNWDILFEGLDTSVPTNMISLKDSSGEKEYEVSFTNVNGNEISFPIAYATGTATLRPGDQNDILFLNNSQISDEGYFILNTDTDEDSVTNVVQYKGADDNTKSDPKIKFKNLATGEILERSVTFGATATASLKLGGITYTVTNNSGTGHTSADDWNITVTGGSDLSGSSDGVVNSLITKGGARIDIRDVNSTTTADDILINISIVDKDVVDDIITVSSTAYHLGIGFNITASSSELDLSNRVGMGLTSPDDDDDNSYGYLTNGAFVKYTSPSGGGTSADSLEIEWPESLRAPLVYLTSGATATSTSADGTLTAVEVVDATKLDSEVADATAQNLIVVGGPCVNTVAAELLGNPADCTEGFTPGKARVKLFENGDSVAMLVAGYSGADTRLAGKVIAQRFSELSGDEVEIEGTTTADATIGAPTVVEEVMEEVVEPEVEEPVVE